MAEYKGTVKLIAGITQNNGDFALVNAPDVQVDDTGKRLNTALSEKANLNSPALTGTPTAPTASTDTETTQIATTAFVKNKIDETLSYADAMVFKGTLGTGGTVTSLPNTHEAGWTYRVITKGTYAGKVCEVGDLIICVKDGTAAASGDWTVVQTNIDGAVTGPASAVANNIAVFDGTTGKVIKDSGVVLTSLINDNAGNGITDKTWSADKLTDKIAEKADKEDTVLTTTLSKGRSQDSVVGADSFAFGNIVEASGVGSHAEGYNTKATNLYSVAVGDRTISSGVASFAEGMGTKASSIIQHVSGAYNIEDSNDKYVEIVGNGTGALDSLHSNARVLDWHGNERLRGDLYVKCNKDSTGGKKVAQQSDVDTKASADNIYTYKEVSGSIVRVEDAVAEPVKQMQIGIAPMQDLHGYANPWVGGAGKNLFNNPNPIIDVQIPQGTIIYTKIFGEGDPMELWGETNENDDITEVRIGYVGNNTLATLTADYNFTKLFFREEEMDILRGREMMISLSEFTDFEPYRNVCPITGWTGCNVTRTRKNLIGFQVGATRTSAGVTYTVNTDGSIKCSGTSTETSYGIGDTNHIVLQPGTYVLSVAGGTNMSTRIMNDATSTYSEITGRGSLIIQPTEPTEYHVYNYVSSGKTIDETIFIQLELGSIASEYEPFAGIATYAITFPSSAGTVYGGTLTINRDGTGELIVNKFGHIYDGTETVGLNNAGTENAYARHATSDFPGNISLGDEKSSHFSYENITTGNTLIGFRIYNSTYTFVQFRLPGMSTWTQAALNNWILGQYNNGTPLTVCYDIDPVPYSLTAPQVQLLLGLNNVWADTGLILNMVYPVEKYLTNEQADKERINIIKDESTGMVSFSNGADDVPMALKVAVEPVQDKHGYDNPWSAGGGKNLLPIFTQESGTVNGITWTNNLDGSVKLNGTATSNSYFGNTSTGVSVGVLPAGNYTVSAFLKNGTLSNIVKIRVGEGESATYINMLTGSVTFTADGVNIYRIALRVDSGVVSSTNHTIYVQLESGSLPTSYVPYSNICPISGWTGANVTRTGKNLIPNDYSSRTNNGVTFTVNSNGSIFVSGTATGIANFPLRIYVKAEWGTVVLSGLDYAVNVIWDAMTLYDANNNALATFNQTTDKERIINLSQYPSIAYIRTSFKRQVNGEVSGTVYPMLRRQNESAEWEPYKGFVYSITFPSSAGTVYGGELTVNKDGTGELVVDRMFCDITNFQFQYISNYAGRFRIIPSSNNIPNVTGRSAPIISSHWKGIDESGIDSTSQWIFCASYAQIIIQMGDASYDSTAKLSAFLAEQANAGNPVTICYEVNPTIYFFTAPQVRSLLGVNNIWTDTGKINKVQYSANTKMYIDNSSEDVLNDVFAHIATLAETQAMINDYFGGDA